MSADDVVRIGGILVEWLSANNYKVGLSFACKFFSIRPFATSFYSEPFWLVVCPPHKGSQHTIVCDSQITLFFLCSFLRLYLVRSRLFTVLSSVIRLLRKCVLTCRPFGLCLRSQRSPWNACPSHHSNHNLRPLCVQILLVCHLLTYRTRCHACAAARTARHSSLKSFLQFATILETPMSRCVISPSPATRRSNLVGHPPRAPSLYPSPQCTS